MQHWVKTLLQQGISEPIFYGDLVYKFKRIVGKPNFSDQFNNFIKRYILSINEKLPVLKFRYFGKYIIQLFGYWYVHVSGQRKAGLER